MTINNVDALKLEIAKKTRIALQSNFTSIELASYADSLTISVMLEEIRTWAKERSGAFKASEKFNDAIDAAIEFADEKVALDKKLFDFSNNKNR